MLFVGYHCHHELSLPDSHKQVSPSFVFALRLSLGLLFHIMFNTTLLSLAISTHLVVVSLSILISCQTRNGPADRSLNARSRP